MDLFINKQGYGTNEHVEAFVEQARRCGTAFNEVPERAAFLEFACRIIILTGGKYDVLTSTEIEELDYHILGKGWKL